MTKQAISSSKNLGNWLFVFMLIAIAIAFRYYRNAPEDYYLLAGSDGPYLPVQVKSILEHYRLAFADMPLLFVLCAGIAKLLLLLKLGSQNECILIAIRFVDTVLPPLAAIPVFYIAQELFNEHLKAKFSSYFLVAFSILNITPLFLFSFQLQKNGLATVFIFSYLYYVLKILKYKNRGDLFKALIIFFLCLITHFGSLGLLLFMSLTTLFFGLLFKGNKQQGYSLKNISIVIVILVAAFMLIAIFDHSRFARIINVPFKIFEAPVLLFALYGQNFVLKGLNLFVVISMNLLAIVALLYIIRNRKEIEPYKLVLGTALSVCTIFLSNPFLGLEWASRLFMLAYIPIGIVYLIIYNSTVNKWFKWSTLSVFAFLLMLSIGTTTFDKTYMAMDNASFLELQTIKDKHIISKQDVIVARQSLRILSNWVFESKGIDKYLLTKEAFGKYPNVYLIKQIKGRNPHTRGHEPNVGDSTALVYQGVHFEVYKLMSNAQLPEQAEKIFKGIKGTIQSFSGNTILVVDVNTNKIRVVEFDAQNNSFPKLQKGMKVEINGEWKAFSLNIVAETIKEIHHFDNQ